MHSVKRLTQVGNFDVFTGRPMTHRRLITLPTSIQTVCCWLVLCLCGVVWTLLMVPSARAGDSQWVRPMGPDEPLTWGRRDGLVFGLASPGGMRGPRGLIRIGIYANGVAEPQVLNFVAVEPVVSGAGPRGDRMAFSELEQSTLDPGQRGKRMWVHQESVVGRPDVAGKLETLHMGKETVERLSVRIDVERYTANGAHVYVVASIDSNHPYEVRLTPYAEPDSKPVEEATLTATMGNFERLRLLWLKSGVVDSRRLFAGYGGTDFVEKESYPLPDMLRTGVGDAIVFCTPSETSPRETPGSETAHWVYALPRFTQYWRVQGGDVQPDLRVRVNARRVYWQSTVPVFGGIAFENFEVRQRYEPGQSFIFGLTQLQPWEFYHGATALRAQSAEP